MILQLDIPDGVRRYVVVEDDTPVAAVASKLRAMLSDLPYRIEFLDEVPYGAEAQVLEV